MALGTINLYVPGAVLFCILCTFQMVIHCGFTENEDP